MQTPRRRARIRRFLSVLLAAWLLPVALPAAQVEGLYEGAVPVTGKDEAERGEAIGRALRQVVAKLTGVPEPGGAVVDAAVAEPQRFLQQFRYREAGDAGTPLTLWARFDTGPVDALVREAGLPTWSAQRPGVLAWVAVEHAAGVELVVPDAGADDAGVARALRERAWQRGVPLSFPLLDLEDRVRVQPAAVWQQEMEVIGQASQRYSPGAILTGRVRSTGAGAWVANWRFQEGVSTVDWEIRGLTAADVSAGALDRIARQLAARYAVSAEQAVPGRVQMRVVGVRTLVDYARVLDYLQGLDQISDLAFGAVSGEEFSFVMQVRGGAEALRRIVSFGGVLTAEPPAADDAGVRFRLLP